MKTRIKLLLAVVVGLFAALVTPVSAQDSPPPPWSYGVYYDVPAAEPANVVQTSLRYLPKTRVSINAMAGLTFKTKQAIGGFSVTRSWQVDEGALIYVGLGITVSAGNPAGWGPTAGLSLRF